MELAILMERGYIAMRRYESEMRTMRVLKSRSATREIRELGNMCRKIANRIASNQVSVEDWPALTGAIGQQLGATMRALKPPTKR